MAALFLLVPLAAVAQPRIPRLGVLIPEMGRPQSQAIKGLVDELKQLGYQERKNIFLETRNAKGDRGALEPAAADLTARKVDVIFTTGTRATQVAKSATGHIPIVFIHPADPIALGLAKSMEGSGSNITGVAGLSLQMTEKRLELLKDLVPELKRILIFYDANNPYSRENFARGETAAKKSSFQVAEHGIKSAEELKATFARVQNRDGDAIFHVPDDLVESEADFIFEIARKKKLPTMFHEEAWAIKGAMAAYGPSYYEMGRQAARLVEVIIKGRKPETLPIERANKFDLTVNYRTANFIGRTYSRDFLKMADKVIR